MDKPNNFLGNLNNDGTRPGTCMRHKKVGNIFGDKTGERRHDEWWRKVGLSFVERWGCRLSNDRRVTLDVHGTKQ
jgi:hypothetical protein